MVEDYAPAGAPRNGQNRMSEIEGKNAKTEFSNRG
jgi:hypothetical protein